MLSARSPRSRWQQPSRCATRAVAAAMLRPQRVQPLPLQHPRQLRPGRSDSTCPSRCVRPRERGSSSEDCRARARSCAARVGVTAAAPPRRPGLQTAGLHAAAPCVAARCGACTSLPWPPRLCLCEAPARTDHAASGGAPGKPATDPGRVDGRVPDPRGAGGGPSCRDRPGREEEQELPKTTHL